MTATPFTCICGQVLPQHQHQTDFKCPHCGRVYNYQGRFLWQEAPGNDLPGSSDIAEGGVGRRAEDEKPDPAAADAALEEAFAEGKLPEEDRRGSRKK